jgi:hypothetical protein
VSDAVDEHLDKAFASLDDVPIRELQATADAIGRRSPLHDFAGIFQNVADAREGGWDASLARFHLAESVRRADEQLIKQIAEAEAPFWGHVRNALRAHRDLASQG